MHKEAQELVKVAKNLVASPYKDIGRIATEIDRMVDSVDDMIDAEKAVMEDGSGSLWQTRSNIALLTNLKNALLECHSQSIGVIHLI